MKAMKPTVKSNNRTVYYSDREWALFIDDVRISSAFRESNRNLTESDFASIPNRDRSIEHLLTMASAMYIDYLYNHRKEYVYDWSACTYRPEMVDENPRESKALLLEIHECCRMVLKKVFQEDWMSRTGYISLVIYFMIAICSSLKDFSVYLDCGQELKDMISHL